MKFFLTETLKDNYEIEFSYYPYKINSKGVIIANLDTTPQKKIVSSKEVDSAVSVDIISTNHDKSVQGFLVTLVDKSDYLADALAVKYINS